MTRRHFTATAAAVSALPAQQSASGKIRIGFVGLNHSHAEEKVKVCQTSGDWELVGCWEPDPKVAAPFKARGVPFLDKDAILSDTSIPVVAIEAEVRPHAKLAIEALEAGKHLHLEKPPSETMADMHRIVDLARKKKRIVQMGYMWRHHPGINAIIEAVKKGWLGDVYLIRGQMNTMVTDRRWEWALFHGGQMYEQGGHLIDPLIRAMGRPTKVTHTLKHHGKFNDDLADNTVAVFEFPAALGIINSAVLQNNGSAYRMFEAQGSNGTAVLRPIEGPPHLEIDLVKAAGPYKQGRHQIALPPFQRYVGDFKELAHCLRTGAPLSVSLDEDLLVQEWLLRASDMMG